MIKALVFDWGDTVMKDFKLPGPMYTWDKLEWIKDLEKALIKLSKDYICVIATNAEESNSEDMKKALSRIGADQYFNYFFSSRDLGYQKPDVKFFLTILKEIGVQAEEAIMIGDNYEKDIVGAAEAGMHTILYNEKMAHGYFEMADVVIHGMDELNDTVKWYED